MKNLLKKSLIILPEITFKKAKNIIYIIKKSHFNYINIDINNLSLINTYKRKLQTEIIGINIQYIQRLVLKGIGFRIEKQTENLLKLKLGFSHDLFIQVPAEINIFLSKKNIIVCKSKNYDQLTLFIAQIQKLKKFDKYKGKGLFKKNQFILLKEGKKKNNETK